MREESGAVAPLFLISTGRWLHFSMVTVSAGSWLVAWRVMPLNMTRGNYPNGLGEQGQGLIWFIILKTAYS